MSMQNDKGGHNMNGLLVGVVISVSLAVFVLQIISYILCQLHRGRQRAATPSQRELLPAGRLDLSDIASLPNFAHRRSSSFGGISGRSGDDKRLASAAAAATADAAKEMVEIECAVCLSALEDEEMVRLLTNCNHVFHVDCIDMWLYSHSTCPVCRADVRQSTVASTKAAAEAGAAAELHSDSSAWLPPV